MQEKDLEISYKILHFYPDLRGNFTLLLAKIVHFFPVKVDNFLRDLKVFFLRSENFIRNLKVFFLHRKGKTPLNSVCVMSILGKNFHFFPVKWRKIYEKEKVFFVRSGKMFTKLKRQTPLNSVCVGGGGGGEGGGGVN